MRSDQDVSREVRLTDGNARFRTPAAAPAQWSRCPDLHRADATRVTRLGVTEKSRACIRYGDVF